MINKKNAYDFFRSNTYIYTKITKLKTTRHLKVKSDSADTRPVSDPDLFLKEPHFMIKKLMVWHKRNNKLNLFLILMSIINDYTLKKFL